MAIIQKRIIGFYGLLVSFLLGVAQMSLANSPEENIDSLRHGQHIHSGMHYNCSRTEFDMMYEIDERI